MADLKKNQPFKFHGFSLPTYTMCPDELFDELLAVLSGAQLKVTLYVIRRTFGFKKQSDNISISQMLTGIKTKDGRQLDRGVGLSKSTLLQAVRELTDMEIIIPTRRGSAERGNEATNYRLNITGLKLPEPTPDDPEDGNEDGSKNPTPLVRKLDQGGSRNHTKGLVGKSDPQDTVIQQVVNALPGNDHKSIPLKDEDQPRTANQRRRGAPIISDRALRAAHGFTDEQIGQVHYLVDKQATLLGAVDRNHAHYVKRAAAAVAADDAQLLDSMLGEFKQAALTISVKSPPSFFHAMWKEALQRHSSRQPEQPSPSPHSESSASLRAALASRMTPPADDPTTLKIARMLENASARGFQIPDQIRRSSHYPTVMRWWAELEAQPDGIVGRGSSAP